MTLLHIVKQFKGQKIGCSDINNYYITTKEAVIHLIKRNGHGTITVKKFMGSKRFSGLLEKIIEEAKNYINNKVAIR